MKKTILIVAISTCINVGLFSQASGIASVFQLASIGNTTYLIDTIGNTYNSWQCSASAASTAYLLKDGSIMRPYRLSNTSISGGAVGGGIQIIDWSNTVTWDYTWSNNDHQQHHECIPIEQANGTYNALLIAWERKDNNDVVLAGRQNTNGEMWPTEIIEIEPVGMNGGNVVWEWHAWDHLCQDVDQSKNNWKSDCSQHPELFDINVGSIHGQGGDWIHANGMDYSPQLDQIVFSSHFLHEIYVIDHSTTSAEASSHQGGNSGKGGDILYRWGNPYNYGGGNNISWNSGGDRELHTVHGANFIDPGYPGAGNLMCFDNEATQDGGSGNSRVVELVAPLNGSTYNLPWNQPTVWTYDDPGNFYANHLSGAFRLRNGNTMATLGTSTYWREVDPQGNILYEYNFQGGGPGGGGNMAKSSVYELDYPGIIGLAPPASWDCVSLGNCQDPGTGNGQYSTLADCLNACELTSIDEDENEDILIYPNPIDERINIVFSNNQKENMFVTVLDVTGKIVLYLETQEQSLYIDSDNLEKGVYLVKIEAYGLEFMKKIVK